VEGHRRYADDSEPTWYAGQRSYEQPYDQPYESEPRPRQAAGAYDSGVHERPSGAFRLPEQRPADSAYAQPAPYVTPDTGSHALPLVNQPTSGAARESVRLPIRGPEYPTIRPTSGAQPVAPDPVAPDPVEPPAPAAFSTATTTTSYSTTTTAPGAATYGEPAVAGLGGPAPRPESVYRTRRPVSSVVVAIVTGVLMVPTLLLLIEVTFADQITARGVVPAVLLTLGLPLTGAGLFALAGGGPSGREAWIRPPVVYLPVGLLLLAAAGLAVA